MARKWFASWIVIIMVVEGLSWLSYGYPSLRSIFTLVVLIVVLLASCYRLQWGIAAVLAELVVGSQGYLLAITWPLTISLRLGLFAVVGLATLLWIVRDRSIAVLHTRYWKWYLALVGFLGLAVLTALWHGNTLIHIFLDANGYLFIAMIVPFTQALRTKADIQQVGLAMLAALTMLVVQTVAILFVFSHLAAFQYYLPELYRWLRDFRLAEITMQDNHFTRVFFQSHLYVLFGFILASCSFILKRSIRWSAALLGTTVTLIFISYSRSFWVATTLVLGVLIMLAHQQRRHWQLIGTTLVSMAIGYVVVLGIINLPLFGSGAAVDIGDLLTDRTKDATTDIGGGSRMALLGPLAKATLLHPLLGSGFGTTVTYASLDQRSIEAGNDGLYTTYAFEWGYLDLWLKLGLVGTILYLSIIGGLVTRLWYQQRSATLLTDRVYLLTAAVGTVALGIVHLLTPYLNHPLGIGWIVLMTSIAAVYDRSQS
ncbi:MAG: O-antigen ligase family protein [Candidatus Kerfeldbacteria bacterium]|nr:O-antigen ligase family protein [Candidatus Kerfeldbacteria bacterium]